MTTFEGLLKNWNNGVLFGAQSRLAKAVGTDQGTVSRWLKGLPPSAEMRPKIAKALGVSPEELAKAIDGNTYKTMKEAGVLAIRESIKPYETRMRVVGTVSAEKFDFSFDYDTGEFADVDLPRNPGKRAAILRVNGDCMEPKLANGDLIVVVEASEQEVPNGGLAVIRLNGEHTLKRVYRVPGGIELRPDNKTHKTIRLSGDEPANVVGSVRWIIRRP